MTSCSAASLPGCSLAAAADPEECRPFRFDCTDGDKDGCGTGKRQREKVDVNTNDCALKSTFTLEEKKKNPHSSVLI